jgi:dTDP-4-dehydrorhamnose reductase
MKIFVFGNTGMLGRYVYTYFRQKGFNTIGINRNTPYDAYETNSEYVYDTLRNMGASSGDVVINCIGLIRQRNETTNLNFVYVNSVFPLILADVCADNGYRLIHPTTDCVFDGELGNYTEDSKHNALDVYGKSKSLGEPDTATVIRTSIIGEELTGKRSLLEWVKSKKDTQITGYTNHFWNGVTCLQFAKICEHMISKNYWWSGVMHVFSNTVSKYELVSLINDIYELNIDIIPKEVDLCDRSLNTVYDANSEFNIPSLYDQLEELSEFKLMEY